MLDARDDTQPYQQPRLGVSNSDVVEAANPWADVADIASRTIRSVPTTPPRALGNGSARSTPLVGSSSSSPSPSVRSGLRSRKPSPHRRVSTVDGSLLSHPLQLPLTSRPLPTMTDGVTTRPALNRRLHSECDLYDGSEHGSSESDLWVNVDGQQNGNNGEAEVMVIVHEVTRTDSIAGVALKYGISLSDLRRANHLWASDSIHLRKVLYIPLHLSSRRDLYSFKVKDNKADTVNGEAPAESSTAVQSRSSVVIQRIPVSQLAFFPPSSQPLSSPDSERKRSGLPFAPTTPSPPRVQSVSESPGTVTLAALLHALPFPLASRLRSRDLFLFPRLSIDSSETSTNVSEASSELEQDHEMDLLGSSRVRTRTLSNGRGHRRGKANRYHRNSTASIETLKKAGYDAEEEDDVPLVPLQTEQLKPSPRMELPRSLRRDGG